MPWDEKVKRRLKLRDLDILMTVIQAGSMGKAPIFSIFFSRPYRNRLPIWTYAGSAPARSESTRRRATPYALALIRRSAAAFNELKHGVEEIENLADPLLENFGLPVPKP